MSAKETKAELKEVRDAIKSENFEQAISKCKELLKIDKENYMVYLLLGAAYQNVDKAEAAKSLRKAVQYSPGPPTVALQGLATCAPPEELPKIFEQLFELLPDKREDYYYKVFTLANNNAAVARECFELFKKERIVADDDYSPLAHLYMAQLWFDHDFEVEESEEMLYKSVLQSLLAFRTGNEQLAVYKRFFKLLYKMKDYPLCIDHACKLIDHCPKNVFAHEWVLKIYSENYNKPTANEWKCKLMRTIGHYAQSLLELNANSSLALLVKAIELHEHAQYVSARELLRRAQQIQPKNSIILKLLAHTEMQLGAYGLAVPLWQQLGILEAEYAECLSHDDSPEKLNEAVDLLLALPQTENNNKSLARCYFKLKEHEKLAALQLDELTKAEFLMSSSAALECIRTDSNLESFEANLLCGKLCFELSNNVDALTYLLKATKLLPHRADCFHYLGKIYYATNDITRARKCYEKCINLNPLCLDAVNNLSLMYQESDVEELNETLLLNTLKYVKDDNAIHVRYKLGLHYLNVNNWDEAIQSFRTVIKHDVNCMLYWESLGDCYVARGSYNSAIRVFQKILEFSPTNIYAQLQIALIKTTIRMYSDAIEDFDTLLRSHENYVPALKGAAEAHVGLAHNLKLEHRYGRARDHLQYAVNHLQNAFLAGTCNDMVWLWRLTAYVFLQTAKMPTKLANLDVSGKLAKREENLVFLTRRDLLELANKFYICALKLKQNTFLWYELACCSYQCALYITEDDKMHLEVAEKACKTAIKDQNYRWQNWNLLGVIYLHESYKNLPLAQHCLIQALNLERKSFTTWTNLGVLYLKLDEIKLANQAFQRAQQSSPIYQNAWIGQAMIAESISEDEEATDLFRHCQQFDYHPESAVGYAHWVCKILTEPELCVQPHNVHAIEHMYADVVALDAINWHIINEEKDATLAALSFQAFLSVRQKLYHSALRTYMQAVKIAEPGEARDRLYTNLGYLYLKLNQPEQAINAFNMIAHATFKPIIGLALAYYRAGQHQESYSVYNSVLKSMDGTENENAASILVAMSSMVYAFQGEVDTKTILYQCMLLKESPIQALYSACALGILHGDNQLTDTILHELKKFENMEEHCVDVAYLTVQSYLAKRRIRQAFTYILSRVHIFPQSSGLRKLLANFLLDHYANMQTYQVATSCIALAAIDLAHNSESKINDSLEDAKSLLIASRALRSVDLQSSLKLVQRAVHLQPEFQPAWDLLLDETQV